MKKYIWIGPLGFFDLILWAFGLIRIKLIPINCKNDPGENCDDSGPTAVFMSATMPENCIVGDFFYMELKEGQKVDVSVALKTRGGNEANYEKGSARFISSDPSTVGVEQDPENELKAKVYGVDGSENGSAVIEFRADGLAGEGVRDIIATLDVVCTQGDAFVASIDVVGTPEDGEPETGGTDPGTGTGDTANGPDTGGEGEAAPDESPATDTPGETVPADPGTDPLPGTEGEGPATAPVEGDPGTTNG